MPTILLSIRRKPLSVFFEDDTPISRLALFIRLAIMRSVSIAIL